MPHRSYKPLVLGLAAMGLLVGGGHPSAAPYDSSTEGVPPARKDEPMAERFSMERAVQFLDGVATAWTRKRRCGTCHTNYPFVVARSLLADVPGDAYQEVRAFFEKRVLSWSPRKRRATEIVPTSFVLAFSDAMRGDKLHEATRKALTRMWQVQQDDGGWRWSKCDWPPAEHDDHYGVALAALATAVAPENYSRTAEARQGLQNLQRFLRARPPDELHHRALLLWAASRLEDLLSAQERRKTIADLLAVQGRDGGWSLAALGDYARHDGTVNDPAASPSDGYGTGLVVYVLRQAGLSTSYPAIKRGAAWLRANQRESGRWFTRSLSNDDQHYISNAGTAYAIMALRSCEQEAR